MPRKKANPNALEIKRDPEKSKERQFADAMIEGVASSAHVVQMLANASFGLTPLRDCVAALRESVGKVESGDLAGMEAMLAGQAIALNAIFHECSRRAVMNLGEHLGAADTYLRLAMKAQSQARATVETLAEIKNPRAVAFVRQANIAQGHQQVINEGDSRPHVREIGSRPNELLEGANVTRLDTGASRPAIGSHPPLEAVGTVHGAKVA